MDSKINSVLEFYPTNRSIYKRLVSVIHSPNGIMPFIGYDLIAFNYGSRDDFLEYLIKENGLERKRDSLICDDYLESLDRILNELTQGILDFREVIRWSLFEDYYSNELIDWYRALNEPINLIQWLNNGSVVTVNFDKMYESLNKTRKPEIATPTNKMLLHHFLRQDSSVESVVFKVHGDLFSDKKNLILTKSEFTNAYTDPEFSVELKQWINRYVLLFVGIDILKDTYLSLILDETKQEGVNHFALIACEDNIDAKKHVLKECSEMSILPILYDINKPDSIRIILHSLLVDSQNKKWVKSFERGRLHYLYNDQLIVGRKEQIEELISFINDRSSFLYCTISGRSIIGKSKLEYDFAQTYANGWRWYMIPIQEINDFLKNQPSLLSKLHGKQDTLFIFDDYSLYEGSLDDIAAFVMNIQRYCLRIRIIFISGDMSESNFTKKKGINSYTLFNPQENLYKKFSLQLYDANEMVEISLNYVLFRRKELHLADAEIDSWRDAIQIPLNKYVEEIILDDPQEALIFSMVYAVKLTLNYLNESTSDTDSEYVTNAVYSYEHTEGMGVGINTEKVDKMKLNHNKSTRLARIEKQSPKINRFNENYNNDIAIAYSGEESFQNLFNESGPSIKHTFGKDDEDEPC